MRSFSLVSLVLAVTAAAQDVRFDRDVQPVLAENCFACHGPDGAHRKARLRLDTREGLLTGGKSGPAAVPGDAARSLLIAKITAADPGERMPPPESHKELSAAEIDVLRRWIAEGAEYRAHWAFVAPQRSPAPAVRDASWPSTFVDRFVLARLERSGVAPSPDADPVTLVRRLAFDLTGLPPEPARVAAFVADRRADRVERLVDELLASPHFGERMAMWWLDLVRYADTVGYHGDQEHPIAPYRDWVIDAFNANLPFDRFTVEQLAGDLLEEPTEQQRVATGYNRLLQTTHEGGAQAREYLAIYAADRVRNLGVAWLGLTTGCAQCHDHKFDPITQRDFYALAAFFADIEEKGDFAGSPNTSPTTRPPEIVLLEPDDRAELERLETELEAARAAGDAERSKSLAAARKRVLARGRRTMVTVATEPRTVRVLARGDWMDESGEIVLPAAPAFLPQIDTGGRRATRLDLARWLTAEDNPLVARVVVNRLWALFFGRGIAGQLDDFGVQAEPPVDQDLLDALAVEFVASGFDLKHVVRLIVTSRAYRQSSVPTRGLAARDPDNRLFARQGRWRLPAESIRDNALAIAGLLVRDVGGDSVRPYQPAGYWRSLNFPQREYEHHTDTRQWRRGVYVHWQRTFLHPMLLAFDAPTREEGCAQRAVSNTPQAALTLLNDPTFVEAARVFAERLLALEEVDDRERLQAGFRLATSRAGTEREVAVLLDLLERHRREFAADPGAAAALVHTGLAAVPDAMPAPELAAWTSVARVLLNLSETTTRN